MKHPEEVTASFQLEGTFYAMSLEDLAQAHVVAISKPEKDYRIAINNLMHLLSPRKNQNILEQLKRSNWCSSVDYIRLSSLFDVVNAVQTSSTIWKTNKLELQKHYTQALTIFRDFQKLMLELEESSKVLDVAHSFVHSRIDADVYQMYTDSAEAYRSKHNANADRQQMYLMTVPALHDFL